MPKRNHLQSQAHVVPSYILKQVVTEVLKLYCCKKIVPFFSSS